MTPANKGLSGGGGRKGVQWDLCTEEEIWRGLRKGETLTGVSQEHLCFPGDAQVTIGIEEAAQNLQFP